MTARRRPTPRAIARIAALLLLLAAGTLAAAQECRIEAEPNDTPADAVPLAPYLCLVGEMAGQDQDAYVWEVGEDAAGQVWTIEIQGIPGQLTKLDVLDVTFAENGVDVAGVDTLLTWGTRDGRAATSEPFVVAPGRYVLGVSKSGGEGQYVAHLRPVAELARGRSTYRDVTRQGEHAVDGLEAAAVGWTWDVRPDDAALRWDLTLTGPVAPRLQLTLLDPGGATVERVRAGEDGIVRLTSLGLDAGTYRIEVDGFDGPAPFAVDAQARGRITDGNEVEPNDDWQTANVMRFDQPFEGAGPGADHILVPVNPEQAARAWDLVVEGAGEDMTVRLFDRQRREVQERRGVGGTLRGLVLEEGEIGIVVDAGESGYRLRFEETDPPADGYEVEPNDVLSAASPLSDELTLRGSLSPQDYDLLDFEVDGDGGLYRVQVIGQGVNTITLVDGNGNHVTRLQGERRLRLDNVALLPGRYAVGVDGDEGDYAVRVLRTGPIPPPTEPSPEEAEADLSGPDEPTPDADTSEEEVHAAPSPPPADPGPPPPPGIVELEPNDEPIRAQLLRPGRIYVGTFPDRRDRDYYRFTLAADRYVRIEWLPPPDGAIGFDTTRGSRAESDAVGRPAVFEGRLLAGDYEVRGYPATTSEGWYRLRLTLLDPFTRPDDAEPNDDRVLAIPLPADLEVDGSVGISSDTDDVFRMPVVERETPFRIEGELGALEWVWLYDPESYVELERGDDGTYVGVLPAGTPTDLRLRGNGPYLARFVFDGPVDAAQLRAPVGPDGVEIELRSDVEEVAAYGFEGQTVDASLSLRNTSDAARTVSFDAAASQWPIRVALPEAIELAAGEARELRITIALPDDLRDDQDLSVTLGARTDDGFVTSNLAFAPRCEAPLRGPGTYFAVPEALVGHLDLATPALGAAFLEGSDDRADELIDGVASPGTGGYRQPGGSFTLDLPGDRPHRLTGTLLNPQSRQILRQLKSFAIDASLDGETFERVFEGELDAARLEQGFVFDEPIEASFVRLVFLDDQQIGEQNQAISLGEWKVLTDDLSPVEGVDLADVRHGGILIWSDPLIGSNDPLAGDDGRTSLDGRRFDEAPMVIGFEHGRAARIDRLRWVDHPDADDESSFYAVDVAVSMEGPIGPWTEVGSWELERTIPGTVELPLDEVVWARYVRVTARGHDGEQSYITPPGQIQILEASGPGYRSILAEWGFARDVGPYEWLLGVDAPPEPLADDGSDDVRAGATPLRDGDRIAADVLVAEDEDWYRIDVPDGANAITLDLEGRVSAIRYRLMDDDEQPVAYDLQETESGVRLTAFVEPGSYYLHVDEPKRSVVFSWDTSGSVRPYEPITYAAISTFARGIDPEREFVQLLAFDDPAPEWLLPYWTGDPTAASRALSTFDRWSVDSSNAELGVGTAVGALSQREGTRALLVITDHESGGYQLTTDLWRSIEEARPRIFTFEVSTAGSGITQDRMQAYAAANDGHYAYARNVGDFDAGFRRASCQLRRAKAYTVEVAVAFQEPPGPGTLTVQRGEGATLPGVEVIFDASGSMGALLPDGTSRLDAAKQVLDTLVGEVLPEGTPFALRAFGHITPQSCESRLELPLEPLDRDAAYAAIDAIQPKLLSQTPIADALRQVASDLEGGDGGTVVLITDGEESCGGDPSAAVEELRAAGIDVNLTIVTLGVESDEVRAGFEALAEQAGGAFAPADDTEQLRAEVEAALYPTFDVLDAAGNVVASGRVGSGSVELPVGVYSVRVPGPTPHVVRDVRIRGDDAVSVTVGRSE